MLRGLLLSLRPPQRRPARLIRRSVGPTYTLCRTGCGPGGWITTLGDSPDTDLFEFSKVIHDELLDSLQVFLVLDEIPDPPAVTVELHGPVDCVEGVGPPVSED